MATTFSEMKRSGIELRREKNRYSAGGKMRGMAALRFGQANVELCRFPTFVLI